MHVVPAWSSHVADAIWKSSISAIRRCFRERQLLALSSCRFNNNAFLRRCVSVKRISFYGLPFECNRSVFCLRHKPSSEALLHPHWSRKHWPGTKLGKSRNHWRVSVWWSERVNGDLIRICFQYLWCLVVLRVNLCYLEVYLVFFTVKRQKTRSVGSKSFLVVLSVSDAKHSHWQQLPPNPGPRINWYRAAKLENL